MTERRTMEEAMEAIERVERNLRTLETYPEPFEQLASDLRLLVTIAKRAVREPSGEEIERMAEAYRNAWIDAGANWSSIAAAIIKAWQECGE